MPVTRLHPLPFPEPARFIAFIEEDPSVLEEGLRFVARRLPLPGAGPSVVLDLLAVDSQSRIAAIQIGPRLTVQALAACLAAHWWISENMPTLRLLCPPLESASDQARAILIAGSVEPSLDTLLDRMAPAAPEVYQGSLFRSEEGLSVSLRRRGRRAAAPAEQEPLAAAGRLGTMAGWMEPAGQGIPRPTSDPLSGIPISSEELAEFRRLVASTRSRAATSRRRGRPVEPAPAGRPSTLTAVEN